MMSKYATGKYDPDEMDPVGIVKSLKKAGIRAGSNFLIGFRDDRYLIINLLLNFKIKTFLINNYLKLFKLYCSMIERYNVQNLNT
jgi:hypothetical protein